MFSKLFSQNKSVQKHNKKSKQQTGLVSLEQVDDRRTQLDALKGADRQLYDYDKPTQELGITDLLKQHEPGSRFLYAAVTGRESEDKDSRMNKLRAWKPFLRSSVESFDEMPNLKLYKEAEVFPIKPLIDNLRSKKNNRLTQEYFRVVEAMVIYGAIVSSDHVFTQVHISINDGRLLGNTFAKGFIADTNKESRGDLRLSYCVPIEDAEYITLVVSREQQFLQDGLQWGAIKIKLSLEFTDFPKQYDNLDVTATNMLVGTVLDSERQTDPDVINISVSNTARKGLAQLYQSGDLTDLEEPMRNAVVLRAAKSSVRDKPKGDVKKYGSGWENMTIPRQNASIASLEPEDDESDTASDIFRRQELRRNYEANLALVQPILEEVDHQNPTGAPHLGPADPTPPPPTIQEDPGPSQSERRIRFQSSQDNLNLFD